MNRLTSLCAAAMIGVVLSGASEAGTEVILVGSEIDADELLLIDITTGMGTPIGPLGDDVISALAYDTNHEILYAASTVTDTLYVIDPKTGATTPIGGYGEVNFTFHAMEYNSNNDVLYAAQEDLTGAPGSELWEIDVTTGVATLVGTDNVMDFPGDMAYDAVNDVMYISDTSTLELYTIDLTDGSTELVGPFNNGTFGTASGLAYDPSVGLFGSGVDFVNIPGVLFEIDTATGEATPIGQIGADGVIGLAFIPVSDNVDIPGDLDGDGIVGTPDLTLLLGDWGPCDNCRDCQADLDGEFIVGTRDLFIMLGNWG